MRYSEDQLNAMAEKIDLAEYIGRTEELHRRGENYFIKCPFHEADDTPSLCIYPDSNSWYCFGCKKGGRIFNWIMERDGVHFNDAVSIVAEMIGVDLTQHIESKSALFLKELALMDNSEKIVNRQELDWQSDYINKSSDELPQEWLDEDMTEESLRIYNIRIDKHSNRIVYPVLDQDGKLIGVKGRTRLKDFKLLGVQKYMNYYKIGVMDFFQGWQQALPEITNTKTIIIFEGIKSCIKAWGWGVRNTVAAETSKLSDGQLELLSKSGLKEVILAFDSEIEFKSIISDTKVRALRMLTNVSIIRDITGLLDEKEAPVDKGEKVFLELLQRRVRI